MVLLVCFDPIGYIRHDDVWWREFAVLWLCCISVASNPAPKVLVRSPGRISSGTVVALRLDLPRLQVGIVRVGALWNVQRSC